MNGSDTRDNARFEVAVWHQDRQSANVVLGGELDLGSAPKLRDCLAELAHAGVINLVMDLANLTFLDSTGISLFVTDFKRSTASGGSFSIRNAPPQAMRVFEITGLVELLSVSPLDSTEANTGDCGEQKAQGANDWAVRDADHPREFGSSGTTIRR